jgi:spore coat polysaccharide biosynthesis protein SpsF
MGSTRLPGKVLLPLAGKPVLERMIERVRASNVLFELVVATTKDPDDDSIVTLCRKIDVRYYRGHATDLIERHQGAAALVEADALVKIPSDCPLIDPRVIDRVLGFWMKYEGYYDYVSNLHPPSYPDGNDVEVLGMDTLAIANAEATRLFEREHLTPYIWERPERFRIGNVMWERELNYSLRYRWTLDYREDYQFMSAVYEHLLQERGPLFSLDDILEHLQRYPDLAKINQRFAGVNWYRHHLQELHTIHHDETRQEPML